MSNMIYFSLGDVVAALGLTMLIPQFLRPIYMLRLRSHYLGVLAIYVCMAFSFICVLVASLLNDGDLKERTTLARPLIWEIAAASSFVIAYGLMGWASLFHVNLKWGSTARFRNSTARLISEGKEADLVDFAHDLDKNIAILEKKTQVLESARWRNNAFYNFTHRHNIKQAQAAAHVLLVCSDAKFCRTIVVQCPWIAASIVRQAARLAAGIHGSTRMIQEIARQAIIAPDSVLGREVGYGGLSYTPVLSDALFNNWYVVARQDPFFWIRVTDMETSIRTFTERMADAIKKAVHCLAREKDFWQARSLYNVNSQFQILCRKVRKDSLLPDYDFAAVMAICDAVIDCANCCRDASPDFPELPDVDESNRKQEVFNKNNLFDAVADLLISCLEVISREFESSNDPFWHLLKEIEAKILDGHRPDALQMDSFQKIFIEKVMLLVSCNLRGSHPPITRVLFAMVGLPSEVKQSSIGSAYHVLGCRFYRALAEMEWHNDEKDPTQIRLFPAMVSFDPLSLTLTRHFRGGTCKTESISI